MHLLRILVLVLYASCAPLGSLLGQASRDLYDLSFEELLEVKVTGSTLRPESLFRVPSAVTVFQGDELDKMGMSNLYELMNFVPGYQSYRSSGSSIRSVYSSRGRRVGNIGSDVLILVDGQRMEMPRTNGGAQAIPDYPLESIERVEFIRGPGSAVFGSNAMLGVINIVTRRDANEVRLEKGSFSGERMTALGGATRGDWSFNLFAVTDEDEGERYEIRDPVLGGVAVTRDPRNSIRLDLKAQWRDTSLTFKRHAFKISDFIANASLEDGQQLEKGGLSSIGFLQEFEVADLDCSLQVDYAKEFGEIQAVRGRAGDFANISSPPSQQPVRSASSYDGISESRFLFRGNWDIDVESELKFGLEKRRILIDDLYLISNYDLLALAEGRFPIESFEDIESPLVIQLGSERDIWGVYGQYQREIRDWIHLTLGLRYDRFSGIGSEVSPRFGVVFDVNKYNSLKVLYGSAFRAPTESELNMANNAGFLGQPDLNPETVQTFDLVWVGQWSDLYFNGGYFESHYKDSISLVSYPGGLNISENVELGPSKGFEFELYRRLGERFLVRANYTYLTEKTELAFREAKEWGALSLNYEEGKWNANLSTTWTAGRQSPTKDGRLINLDDFWTVSGKLEFELSTLASVYLRVSNIADEQYLTPVLSANLTQGIPNRGREITIGSAFRF